MKIESFVEAGKASPEQLEYLQGNHAGWRAVWDGAIANEAEGRTSVYEPGWDSTTTPTEVTVTPEGYAVITIKRCIDPSKITDYIGGVEQPRPLIGAYEQTVGLQRDTTGKWKVSGISADPEATCELSAG